jgi:hypothetical protein
MPKVLGNKKTVVVPKKFAKAKKSFVARLADDVNNRSTAAFCAFPPGVSFMGQDEGEHVVLLVRQHLAVLIPKFILIFLTLLSPLLFFKTVVEMSSVLVALGMALLILLIAFTMAADTFFKWFYGVNIVTDQRIVDVDFNNVLYHKVSEAQLERIEDVSHAPAGLFSAIFDYGDVYIQTASSKPEFDFNKVPKPREIQDTLLDLLEMKQK